MYLEKHSFESVRNSLIRCTKIRAPRRKTVFKSTDEEVLWRNIDCRQYLDCLDSAVRTNNRDLGCGRCPFKDDKSYQMNERDFFGLSMLLNAIKNPNYDPDIESIV